MYTQFLDTVPGKGLSLNKCKYPDNNNYYNKRVKIRHQNVAINNTALKILTYSLSRCNLEKDY